jgi:hypothetical protein
MYVPTVSTEVAFSSETSVTMYLLDYTAHVTEVSNL